MSILSAYFLIPEKNSALTVVKQIKVMPAMKKIATEPNIVKVTIPKEVKVFALQSKKETAAQVQAAHASKKVTNNKIVAVTDDKQNRIEPVAVVTAEVNNIVPAKVQKPVKQVATVRQSTTKQRAGRWFNTGKEAFQFGLVAEAIKALDKTLVLMPLHIEARSLLAAAYYGREQTDKAESILRYGLSLNPDVMRWRILLAKILIEQNKYQAVEPVLPSKFEMHASTDFWILKGTAAQQLGEHKVANKCFTKLTQLQPTQAKWWLALGASNDALAQYSDAKRFYMMAIELGGLSPNSHKHAKQRLTILNTL